MVRSPRAPRSFTVPRFWAWPGSITPTRRRASTTGRRWACSGRSEKRCRPTSGRTLRFTPTASPSSTRCPSRPRASRRCLADLSRAKCYAEWTKDLKNYLYREWKLTIWSCPELKAYSRPGKPQRDFRLRLSQGSREQRDRAIAELRAKYAPKRDRLQEKVRKARERLDREQAQASTSTWDAAVSFGSSVLDFMLGRKTFSKTNVGRATSAAKAANRAVQQRGDVGKAGADLDAALEKFTNLEIEIQDEIENIKANGSPELLKVEPIELAPRKADITIEQVVLAWTPWKTVAGAAPEAAY